MTRNVSCDSSLVRELVRKSDSACCTSEVELDPCWPPARTEHLRDRSACLRKIVLIERFYSKSRVKSDRPVHGESIYCKLTLVFEV